MPFTKVATVQEIPVGKGKQVTVNGKQVALFNVGGAICAMEDTCCHRGAPLPREPAAPRPVHFRHGDAKTAQRGKREGPPGVTRAALR